MLRVVIGLALFAFPLTLALAGELPPGALGLGTWLFFGLGGAALAVAGALAFAREIRQARSEPQGSGLISGPTRSVLSALCAVGLVPPLLWAQMATEQQRADWPAMEEILHLPKPDVIRALALNSRGFAADLVWLRAIGYFGDHFYTDHRYGWLEKYLDTVIELDPQFRVPYRYAGTVTMYNLRVITREAVERSTHYLELGYKRFPTDWEFPFAICSNYVFELTRFAKDAAEKRRFQEIGAEYCREASVLPGASAYLGSLAGTILSRLGKRQLARQHFRELILRTEDPKMRERLRQKYAALASEEAAKKVEGEATRFFREHQASYPYASADLFLHVGPRGGAFDAGRTLREAIGP